MSGLRVPAVWSVSRALLMRAKPGQLRVRALAHVTLVWALARVEAHVITERR